MPLVNAATLQQKIEQNGKFVSNNFAFFRRYFSPENRKKFFPDFELYDRGIWAPEKEVVFKADPDSAAVLLNQLREVLGTYGGIMGKNCRPWDMVPETLELRLDRNKQWWGFEFETGWKNNDARKQAIQYAWDNFDGAMYDSEGEGGFPVEITFLPNHAEDYLNGSADAYKFSKWVGENIALVNNTGRNNTGTHWNVSDPRMLDRETVLTVGRFLNNTLRHTVAVNGHRKKLFGRETIFGGFYLQCANGSYWLEFKGFRTAYTEEEFKTYVQTCNGLAKCIDTAIALYGKGQISPNSYLGVSNLYDVTFNGADPILKQNSEIIEDEYAANLTARQFTI